MKVVTVAAAILMSTSRLAAVDVARDAGWSERELSFASADGATLVGTLFTPRVGEPQSVVVLVHGSGRVERMRGLGALLAMRRIAVLTYDKRGVGKSGGVYEHNNISAENLSLLADDAAAAMQWIMHDGKVRALPRGFIGISQGGWISTAGRESIPVH